MPKIPETSQQSFKHVHERVRVDEDVRIPGVLLPYRQHLPEIDNGQGAVIIGPEGSVAGNIQPESWRVRGDPDESPLRAVNGDIVHWNLKPREKNRLSVPIHPDHIAIGPEDEGSLILPDPYQHGDLTKIESTTLDKSPLVRITPELLVNSVELTGVGGFYGFDTLLSVIRTGRRELMLAARETGQFLIFTGAEPMATTPPIHPHPYLQKAGRVVADRYLDLDPESAYFRTFAQHLLGPDWRPEEPEQRLAGLAQFRVNGYQTNINIPEDDESLAIPVGNGLTFSQIAIKLGGLLNSTPAVAGILTPWSDGRFFVKRVLASAGPQETFQSASGSALERVNQQIVEGWVPTVARGMCLGANGYSTFHALGRIRGDRAPGSSTWEDMIPSSTHDQVQAAYGYIKACQASYLIHCQKNEVIPEQNFFAIPSLGEREALLKSVAEEGPKKYTSEIVSHLDFLKEYLEKNDLLSDNFRQAQQVIWDTLSQPSQMGVRHYLNRKSSDYRKGLLSDHLRADIERRASEVGADPKVWRYSQPMARAINLAMMDYARALHAYYDL